MHDIIIQRRSVSVPVCIHMMTLEHITRRWHGGMDASCGSCATTAGEYAWRAALCDDADNDDGDGDSDGVIWNGNDIIAVMHAGEAHQTTHT